MIRRPAARHTAAFVEPDEKVLLHTIITGF
jgi:hypothetical protein